jgi:hypothetical protein
MVSTLSDKSILGYE